MKASLSIRTVLALAALAAALPTIAIAGKDNYGEPLAAYKGELKREGNEMVNGSFYGDTATSQAKRAIAQAKLGAGGVDAAGNVIATSRGARGGLRDGGGGLNFASPTINGQVRGNVFIVVEQGAVRGSITSVRE